MDNNFNETKQDYNQQNYGNECYNQPPKKKKNTTLIIVLAIVIPIVLIIALVVGILTFVFSLLKSPEYKFEGGSVQSYYSVTQKMPNESNSNTENGSKHIENVINYSDDNDKMFEDLKNYYLYLDNQDFVLISDFNLNDAYGTIDMAKNSDTDGEIIRITLDYEPGKVELSATQYEDTLVIY